MDLNATQAAIRAGYSRRTAVKIGSENLIKPDISREIQRRWMSGRRERA
ncbi:terminase small subunit [Xanthobacter oligotrophicus]|nr:terminase small subunit [Xanthobacter oligotrophicus]MCG5237586.1 terminase small subunit [Xanthobacter oligotrophicus]